MTSRDADRTVLFIMGVSRSGTSALTRVLNAHARVCLGMERYKFSIATHGRIENDFFSQQRFFDFRPTDTNAVPERSERLRTYYEEMAHKYGDALVVGDKIPNISRWMRRIQQTFPPVKFVYIFRHVHRVALSWQDRAERGERVWPNDRGCLAAVEKWNRENQSVVRLVESGWSNVLVVEYEGFFAGRAEQLARFSRFLDIDLDDAIKDAYASACATYAEAILNKERAFAHGLKEQVDSTADWQTYDRLREISERVV